MKVLVTGGTGFVGREVVRQLHAAGHRARLLVRDPLSAHARALQTSHGVDLWKGDVLESRSLDAATEDCEGVIHLVGIISEVGRQTFERVHTDATRHVLAAAQSTGVRRFLHMSALGTREGAAARYHRSKWEAEQAVRASQLDWTIFRPSIIYGPGDGFVNLFARLSRWSLVVPLIGGGRTRFQPVHVQDVARCFVAALTTPQSVRQAYDLCGCETLTLRQIVDAILMATHRRRLKVPLPVGIANLQAAGAEFCFGFMGRPSPLNRDQILMLQEDNVGDGSRAAALFGLSPRLFAVGISQYLNPARKD